MNAPCHVQIQRAFALVVGENQTIRFLVSAKEIGRFPITITTGVGGKFGDSTTTLFLNVVDGAN